MNNKGSITAISCIDGAVLVNGDFTSIGNSSIGNYFDNIKSYIKGTIGNDISTNSQRITDSSCNNIFNI